MADIAPDTSRPNDVRRAFVDLPHGQVHYRHAGTGGRPLLMLHAGPGSARQLEPLIADLASTYRVIAPDMPGNGDSEPLAIEAPDLTDYAAALLGLIDALGLDRVAVYGSHTGAALAAELAILAPTRVDAIVMDGLGVFSPNERDDLLANYAHPFVPDLDGAYLMRAMHFLRDQYVFFPWYDRTRKALLDGAGLAAPRDFHRWLVEVLKAGETYHLAYRAAFAWRAHERLPLVGCPALLMAAANDPLHAGTRDGASLPPRGRFVALPRYDDPAFVATRRALIVEAVG